MKADVRLLPRSPKRALHGLMILLVALAAIAQSSAQEMISWEPGMDHAYQEGVLWLKADATGRTALAVSVTTDTQYIAVQIAVTNHSSGAVDIFPDSFSMTLSKPLVKTLVYVPPERILGKPAFRFFQGWEKQGGALWYEA